ncbi:Hypothetical Protein FCC1311_033802 [Hondaea fermentalgiana]|uniref:Uncharacterized protein n=1 Tax=Hondaea fermentalgiana TaxID=2315210 RepID=A0A2R5G7Z3_9STRA|nr:Hypothetical Protein FCC1311_033802 [Hondaea fermentalgiana]|eukprot:GBG27157.1 Hypothetical Protein FCC1311_033802 [Hondaea fermentalgiana]
MECVDWTHTEVVRQQRKTEHMRKFSMLQLSAGSSKDLASTSSSNAVDSGETLNTKKKRALRLLRVMNRMYGDNDTPPQTFRFDDRKRFPVVGYAALSASTSTLSTLKKVFYNQTKNKHVLVGEDIVLVCCDVVGRTESQVVTTTFVKYLLSKFVNGRQARLRKTLENILTDFELGLSGDRIETAESIYALVGLSKMAQCQENQRHLAWDRQVNDGILNAVLNVLQHQEPDLVVHHRESIQFHALIALWSLASCSFVLCSRFGTLPVVPVLTRYLSVLHVYKEEISCVSKHVRCCLGALAALSTDQNTQAELWPVAAAELTWALSTFGTEPQTCALVFQIVRNGSVELRKYLESNFVAPTHAQYDRHSESGENQEPGEDEPAFHLVLEMLAQSSEVLSSQSRSKRRILAHADDMLSVLANCSAIIPMIPATFLDFVFHCAALVDMYAKPRYVHNATTIQILSLEMLIDTFAGVDEVCVSPALVECTSTLMLKGLCPAASPSPDASEMQSAIAFNLARLRFRKSQRRLGRELLENEVIEALLDAFTEYKVSQPKLALQITAALVTITSFARRLADDRNLGKNVNESLDKVTVVLDWYARANEDATTASDWLRDTNVISNCASLVWNLRGSRLATPTHFCRLEVMSTAYFAKDKPVWALTNGAMCASLIDVSQQTKRKTSSGTSDIASSGVPAEDANDRAAGNPEADDKEIRQHIAQTRHDVSKPSELTIIQELYLDRVTATLSITETLLDELPSEILDVVIRLIRADALQALCTLSAKDCNCAADHVRLASAKILWRLGSHFVQQSDSRKLCSDWQALAPRMIELTGACLRNAAAVITSRVEVSAVTPSDFVAQVTSMALSVLTAIRADLAPKVDTSREGNEHTGILRAIVDAKVHNAVLDMFICLCSDESVGSSLTDHGIDRDRDHGAEQTIPEDAERARLLGCLLILSENPSLQLRLARRERAIELLYRIAKDRPASFPPNDIPSCRETCAELAGNTLLNLKANQGNLTAFYMVELSNPALRSKLKVWSDERHAHKSRKGMPVQAPLDPSCASDITLGARVPRRLDSSDQVHAEPLARRSATQWFVRVHEEAGPLGVAHLFAGRKTNMSDEDLLPAPKANTATERLSAKAVLLRGMTRQPTPPPIANFYPEHKLNPHAFLCPTTGLVLEIPLELVFTRESKSGYNAPLPSLRTSQSNMTSIARFLQASSMSITLEDDDEWDLEDSVFGPRADAKLDAGRFWNTEEVLQAAINWDLTMCMRKPSFVRAISSQYSKADLVTAVSYVENNYTFIGMAFLYYTSTERVEVRSLVDATYNIFCLSRNQYWQFLEDNSLLEVGSHLTISDFDDIFARVTSEFGAVSRQELRVSQQSAVFLHGKRGAPMCRYQFVELIFLLADAIFVRAPPSHPQRVKMLCRAVLILVDCCFKQVAEIDSLNSDLFRHNSLYRVSIHNVFQRSARALREHVFNRFAGTASGSAMWGGARGVRMSLVDWNDLIDQLGLLQFDGLSNADCNIVFQLSILTVVDLVQSWEKACSLTFVSFLEALARLALYLPLPTRAELAAHGVTSIAAYYDLYHAADLWTLLEENLNSRHHAFHNWLVDHGGQYALRHRRRSSCARDDDAPRITDLAQRLQGATKMAAEADVQHTVSSESNDSAGKGAFNGLSTLYQEGTLSSMIEPEQAQAIVDLFLAVDFLKSKRELRSMCWAQRLTPLHESQTSFDVLVALSLHLEDIQSQPKIRVVDGLRAQGREMREPLIRIVEGVECDIANTPFPKLHANLRRDYLVTAHTACDAIRKDLEDSKWAEHLETVNMMPMPPVRLCGHQLEGEQIKINIGLPRSSEQVRMMINEADAITLKRLCSRRFEEQACRMLYRAWKLRNPLEESAQIGVQFEDLSLDERRSHVRTVHIAVLVYADHLQRYWQYRSQDGGASGSSSPAPRKSSLKSMLRPSRGVSVSFAK